MHRFTYVFIILGVLYTPILLAQPVSDTLRLSEAIQQALQEHPLVQTAYWQTEVARGQIRQAGLWPNPVIEIEGEEWQSGRERKPSCWRHVNVTGLPGRSLQQHSANHRFPRCPWKTE